MAHETDCKGKIRNLLALAQSPNENEAKAALLKARELMAKHKLTEAELGEAEKQSVRNILTENTCSKRRSPWIAGLAAVIAENYCCKGYRTHRKGQQTQTVGFIGIEEDVEICVSIFKYAVDCALAEIKRIKKESSCYPPSYVRSLCDSYGYGFVSGVAEAFDRQGEAHKEEWGLVLVMPKEVAAASQHLKREAFRARTEDAIVPSAYSDGYTGGKNFNPSRRLAGAVTA